jgi:hypothetical protein
MLCGLVRGRGLELVKAAASTRQPLARGSERKSLKQNETMN